MYPAMSEVGLDRSAWNLSVLMRLRNLGINHNLVLNAIKAYRTAIFTLGYMTLQKTHRRF